MTQHPELIDQLRQIGVQMVVKAAYALEAQAREIAELKAREAELCTLYGLAEAECKKLRAELDRANKVAALIHEGLKTIPQDEPTPHGAQP